MLENPNGSSSQNGEQDKIEKQHSIAYTLRTFIRHIDSMASSLPLSMAAVREARLTAANKLQFFEEKYTERHNIEGKKYIIVEAKHEREFKHLNKELSNITIAERTLPRSFLVSLISQYDAFLGQLIHALFYVKPEVLNSSDRNLSFSDLVGFGSLEEAREYIIEKEIEVVLRKSHSEQFDWIEKRFNIELRKRLDIWSNFIEVTERRNLFVHTGGVVSSQYLKVCKNHGVEFEKTPDVGSTLEASPDYFLEAYRVIYEIGVKLAHVLWRKLEPKQRSQADYQLIEAGFELLHEEKYDLAKSILDFSTSTLKQYFDEKTRRIFIVNRAQAYKWSGDEKKALEIMAEEDWSAVSDVFKLADAVIKNEYSRAAELMRRIGPEDENISVLSYRDWPLFKKFRETEEFLQAYEEIAGEPFETEIQIDTEGLEDQPEILGTDDNDGDSSLSADDSSK